MSIFEKAFRDTIGLPVWKYLIGTIGSFLGLLLFCRNFFAWSVGYSALVGIVIIIILFIVCYLYFLCKAIKAMKEYEQGALFDSALERFLINQSNAYVKIRSVQRISGADDSKKIEALGHVCDELKRIFDRKTGAPCGVSIKVLRHPDKDHSPITKKKIGEYTVENLIRDFIHSSRDSKEYMETEHALIENTPYIIVINKMCHNSSKPVYINNDIDEAISSNNYLNTSIGIHVENGLPYKSELVYPIIPAKCPSGELQISYMVGFICVDCAEPNRFNKCNSDVILLRDVADAIYDIIKSFNHK